MKKLVCIGALALVSAALVSGFGCSVRSDGESGDEESGTGMAQVAISQVPFDGSVGCIAVTATGSHTVTQSVDVVSGQSTVLDMTGLPVGTVEFIGNAYQGPCAAVTPASKPTWVSAPVLASVNNLQPVMVHLLMHRNGKADVDVDFEEEPACRDDGAPCLDDAECCSQSCVAGSCQSGQPGCMPGLTSCGGLCADLMSDSANCGGCGNACPPGAVCQNAVCLMVASCADAIKNGQETGVDCGGPCPSCPAGEQCLTAADCQSGLCQFGLCANASCGDNVKNGAETDIDCGGPQCPLCAAGNACQFGTDCQVDLCLNSVCAQCQFPNECPGADTECQLRTCAAGTCGLYFVIAGEPVNTQVPGDCTQRQCDGAGSSVNVLDDSDVPDDGNECTLDMCANGVPLSLPAAAGTPCSQNGTICDGAGSCI